MKRIDFFAIFRCNLRYTIYLHMYD